MTTNLIAHFKLVEGDPVPFEDMTGILASFGYESTSESRNIFYSIAPVDEGEDPALWVSDDVREVKAFGPECIRIINGFLRRISWGSCDVKVVDTLKPEIESAMKIVLIRKCERFDSPLLTLDEFKQQSFEEEMKALSPTANNQMLDQAEIVAESTDMPSSNLSETELTEILEDNLRLANEVADLKRQAESLKHQTPLVQAPAHSLQSANTNLSLLASLKLTRTEEIEILEMVLKKQFDEFINMRNGIAAQIELFGLKVNISIQD